MFVHHLLFLVTYKTSIILSSELNTLKEIEMCEEGNMSNYRTEEKNNIHENKMQDSKMKQLKITVTTPNHHKVEEVDTVYIDIVESDDEGSISLKLKNDEEKQDSTITTNENTIMDIEKGQSDDNNGCNSFIENLFLDYSINYDDNNIVNNVLLGLILGAYMIEKCIRSAIERTIMIVKCIVR